MNNPIWILERTHSKSKKPDILWYFTDYEEAREVRDNANKNLPDFHFMTRAVYKYS